MKTYIYALLALFCVVMLHGGDRASITQEIQKILQASGIQESAREARMLAEIFHKLQPIGRCELLKVYHDKAAFVAYLYEESIYRLKNQALATIENITKNYKDIPLQQRPTLFTTLNQNIVEIDALVAKVQRLPLEGNYAEERTEKLANLQVEKEAAQQWQAEILEKVDGNGNTPLMNAVKANLLDLVEFLLPLARINHVNKQFQTALDIAVERNNEKAIGLLEMDRAMTSLEVPTTANSDAGTIRDLQRYLQGKVPINQRDYKGNTLLHYVARVSMLDGGTKALEYLLNTKADATIKNKAGQTALQFAQEALTKNQAISFRDKKEYLKKVTNLFNRYMPKT